MRNLSLLPLAVLLAPFLGGALPAQWTPWLTVPGESDGDAFGRSVSAIGDLDGDGQPDLLIGAPAADLNGRNSGAVYAVSGLDGTLIYAYSGEGPGDNLGVALAALGDLTGDGLEDFAVSAPYFSRGAAGFLAGRVYLVSGDGSVLFVLDGTELGGVFGISLAAVDLDEDGQKELAVGAIGEVGTAGAVHYYLWDGVSLIEPFPAINGLIGGEMLGWSLAGMGDVNGVAGEEIVAGSPFASGTWQEGGAVSLWATDTPLASAEGGSDDAHLGLAVSSGRDVDGDGVNDLAAGAPDAQGGAGEVLVLAPRGNATSLATLATLNGAAGERFGWAVELVSDATFDTLADLAVGAPEANAGAGRVDIHDVIGGTVEHSMDGAAGSALGSALARLGDVNSTGFEDLALGAPEATSTGGESGEVQVWTPPITSADPPDLTILGSITEGFDVRLRVTNINPGADVYFYVALDASTGSTTAEGWDVDINGRHTGAGGPLIALYVENAAASDTVEFTWEIPIGQSQIGPELHFQVVEDFGGLQRLSDVEGGPVEIPPFTLEVGTPDGEVYVGQDLWLHTFGGNTNQLTYFYYSLIGPGNDEDPGPFNNWNTGLSNPTPWPVPFTTSDSFGVADSSVVTVPASALNRTVWFSAFSWAPVIADQKLSNIVSKTVLP